MLCASLVRHDTSRVPGPHRCEKPVPVGANLHHQRRPVAVHEPARGPPPPEVRFQCRARSFPRPVRPSTAPLPGTPPCSALAPPPPLRFNLIMWTSLASPCAPISRRSSSIMARNPRRRAARHALRLLLVANVNVVSKWLHGIYSSGMGVKGKRRLPVSPPPPLRGARRRGTLREQKIDKHKILGCN